MNAQARMPHGDLIEDVVVRGMRADSRRPALATTTLAMISTLVIGGLLFTQQPAAAAGPPPLPFAPVEESPREVVESALARLALEGDLVDTPQREARWTGWYADLQMTPGENSLTTIRPEQSQITWSPDLSGRVKVWAGEPFSSDGVPVADPSPPVGTLLSDIELTAERFSPRVTDPPAPSRESMLRAVNASADGDGTQGAADHIRGFAALLKSWTLPDSNHAKFLEILLDDHDMTVAGTTSDREGRPVIGLEAVSNGSPWIKMVVLVSLDTGRVVGAEELYIGSRNELDVPVGTVIAYTVWGNGR